MWRFENKISGFVQIFTTHAQKRLCRSFRSKLWPRNSLRQPRLPIRQMYFHNRVTFTGYIRCFCATTSHDLVTMTLSLFTFRVFYVDYFPCPNPTQVPIFIILRLSVTELWITEFDHISVIRHSHYACAMSRDLLSGGKTGPHFCNTWPKFHF